MVPIFAKASLRSLSFDFLASVSVLESFPLLVGVDVGESNESSKISKISVDIVSGRDLSLGDLRTGLPR